MPVTRRTANGHMYELFVDSEPPEPYTPGRKKRGARKRSWGWDCITCNNEASGFKFLHDADQDALDFHDQKAQTA